jgi:hypothetical protein
VSQIPQPPEGVLRLDRRSRSDAFLASPGWTKLLPLMRQEDKTDEGRTTDSDDSREDEWNASGDRQTNKKPETEGEDPKSFLPNFTKRREKVAKRHELRRRVSDIEKERGIYSTWDYREIDEDMFMESREAEGTHAGGEEIGDNEIRTQMRAVYDQI